jgi:beta-xylosidase
VVLDLPTDNLRTLGAGEGRAKDPRVAEREDVIGIREAFDGGVFDDDGRLWLTNETTETAEHIDM